MAVGSLHAQVIHLSLAFAKTVPGQGASKLEILPENQVVDFAKVNVSTFDTENCVIRKSFLNLFNLGKWNVTNFFQRLKDAFEEKKGDSDEAKVSTHSFGVLKAWCGEQVRAYDCVV